MQRYEEHGILPEYVLFKVERENDHGERHNVWSDLTTKTLQPGPAA